MGTNADQVLAQLHVRADETVGSALKRLEQAGLIDRVDPTAVARAVARAADQLAADLTREAADTSILAHRIGPIHTVDELTRRLVAPGGPPLTGEAVRKRSKQRALVAFLTDDRQWAFPDWQFDHIGGRLVPNRDIVTVWRHLPHDSFLTDADLAAWMNTHHTSLPAGTPAETARQHGNDHPALAHAMSRLRQRAA